MPWVSARSQTNCAPLGFPHHPSPLLCRRHPEAFRGPPALQTRLKKEATWFGEVGERARAIQKQASGLHVCMLCKHIYAQTHAHPRTHTPVSSCLLALLALISLCFPEAAPTSGTAEPRTAPQPRLQRGAAKSPIQTCASSAPHF